MAQEESDSGIVGGSASTNKNGCIEECSDAPPSDDLKKRLEPIGIITCEFYFLENAQKNPERRCVDGKKLEVVDGVDEKAVKGEALSHQAT